MTPEELAQTIEEIMSRLQQLEAWRVQRMRQQLTMPVDTISKQALGAVLSSGFGSKTITSTIGSTPATVTKIPTGTIIISTPNGQFEIPYY